jgi:hypothetical protein
MAIKKKYTKKENAMMERALLRTWLEIKKCQEIADKQNSLEKKTKP